MNSFEQLIGNRVLVSAVVGWFVAQVLKTVIHTIVTKKFEPERLTGSGGMPSFSFLYRMRDGGSLRSDLRTGFF